MSILVLSVLSRLFLTGEALAGEFRGQIVGVIEADSIRFLHDGKAEQGPLNGIDCPEKNQPYGTGAKQSSSAQAFRKRVLVQVVGRDRYGRPLAQVTLPDGRSLNQELLKAGLAWWFRRYSKNSQLGDLESEARLRSGDSGLIPIRCRRGSGEDQQAESPTGPLSRFSNEGLARVCSQTLDQGLAGCGKSPPAAFSHRSDAQRTAESTIRLFARCGLAGRPFCASCGLF